MAPSSHKPQGMKILAKLQRSTKKWDVKLGDWHATLYAAMITPELAQEIIDNCNVRNRDVRNKSVLDWSKQMKDGAWQLRGSLIFNESGEMLDGQHRLKGVILSEMSIPFFIQIVPTKMTKAVVQRLDDGDRRNLADWLHFNDVPEAKRTAPILVFERDNRIAGSPLLRVIGDKPDYLALYEEIGPEPFQKVFQIMPRGISRSTGMNKAFLEWFALHATAVDETAAELFFGLLHDPSQLRATDAPYAMRAILDDLYKRNIRVSDVQQAHMLAKAWKHFGEGKPVKSALAIKHRMNEPWPGVYGEEIPKAKPPEEAAHARARK